MDGSQSCHELKLAQWPDDCPFALQLPVAHNRWFSWWVQLPGYQSLFP